MESNVLHLNLKSQWYNMIESGVKKEEYREITPFWEKRLLNGKRLNEFRQAVPVFKKFDCVKFHFGYTKRDMTFKIESISIGTGDPAWGAMPNVKYYVIKLGDRIE